MEGWQQRLLDEPMSKHGVKHVLVEETVYQVVPQKVEGRPYLLVLKVSSQGRRGLLYDCNFLSEKEQKAARAAYEKEKEVTR